jgi:hypothetical protein
VYTCRSEGEICLRFLQAVTAEKEREKIVYGPQVLQDGVVLAE